MADPLTSTEVERYARMALGQLYSIAYPRDAPRELRNKIDNAAAAMNELLMLCELVDAVHDGIVVVCDR